MRINFNILWIDDEDISYYRRRLFDILEEQGFRLKVEPLKNKTELDDARAKGLYWDNIDLIMIDYELGHRLTGVEVIKEVRNYWPYKTLIFYSVANIESKKEQIKQEFDSVVCCDRQYLTEEFEDVLKKMIGSQLDLAHSRGIIIDWACNIDDLVWKSVEKLVKGGYYSCQPDFDTLCEKLKGRKGFIASQQRLEYLEKILETMKDSEAEEHKEKVGKFRDNYLPKRNTIAHSRVESEKYFKTKLLDDDNNYITEDEMKKIRIDGIGQLEIFEKIYEWAKDLPSK